MAGFHLMEGQMAEKTHSVAVKNTAPGPRGLHTTTGHVLLEPGEVRKVEIEDGELASAKGTGHFEIPAKGGDKPDKADAE